MTTSQQSADRTAYATAEDIAAGRVTGVGIAFSVEHHEPVTVYMNEAAPQAVPAPVVHPPAEQSVIIQAQPRDPWPSRIVASGGAIAGVAATVGHFAAGLGQAAHAAEIAGIGVGAAAAGIWLLKGTAPKVTVNISNSNTGSSSSSSSTSSSSSRSGSGWKSRTS